MLVRNKAFLTDAELEAEAEVEVDTERHISVFYGVTLILTSTDSYCVPLNFCLNN